LPLPVATCNGGGASYTRNDTGWIYTIGGTTSTGLTANVRRYNVNTNTWSDMIPLFTPLEYFAAATLNNYIYIIGGYNGTNCLNSFYKYDINLNSWTTTGINFPLAAADCKAVGYQDSLIYVAGGYTTTAISNVYLYNKNSNTFRAATSLPAARQDGAFSRSGDTLVYVGGLTTGSVVTATTYKGLISQTNRSTITWTTGADHPGGPREGWDAANWGSYGVIAVGGYNGTSFTNSCYRYSPGANTWTILTDKPTTEYTSFVGSVYVGNNIWKLIAAGGWTGFNLSTNEIYTETIPTVPIPSLISPVNGSIGVSLIPLLDWNDASGAISYRIQISSDSTFATIQWDTSGITVSQAQVPAEKLTLSTKYYWRVNATNSVGSGPWSTIWNFTTVTTGIHKISSEVPNSFRVYQNYPNPFNPSTKIRYDLPKNSFVKLVVFDMLGREIETLVNENQTTGVYEATFDASQYPSGLYFYRLTTENYSETKKMILMK
jgi:N-acetylneuraminic acid mutarotase